MQKEHGDRHHRISTAETRVSVLVALGLVSLRPVAPGFYFVAVYRSHQFLMERKTHMRIKKKKYRNGTFDILEHDELPGFRKAFHIIICVAVIYFIYIFSYSH